MADMLRQANDWDKSSLSIEWNSTERFFSVEFKGSGDISLPLDVALSQKIPLKIAEQSRCQCGGVLTLGDYSIFVEDDRDFRFRGVYFCPDCKTKAVAEKKGFRKIMENWYTGLKKIEIKATGVGIERQ